MTYNLRIEGAAIAKARPRVGRNITYTPQRTHDWEEWVGACWLAEHGQTLLAGPLDVSIVFHGKGRGDIDNLCKSVLDGLNGVAWQDDRQVMKLCAEKRNGPTPYVDVEVREMKGEA